MKRLGAAMLAAALAGPCRGEAWEGVRLSSSSAPTSVQSAFPFGLKGSFDPDVSTAAARPPAVGFGWRPVPGQEGRGALGAGGGLSEGKPLEMSVWGAAGAVTGSLAGPPGAVIGGVLGAVGGLLISIFVVPRNGPHSADGGG